MRNPVACVSCRVAKQRCIHEDGQPPCDRCKASGKNDCIFPPSGTSAIHRKPKRPRQSEDLPDAPLTSNNHASPTNTTHALAPNRRNDAPASNGSPTNAALSPSAASSILDRLDPFDLLTDEVKNSYLRCSYKWSFHHTPTLLLQIRDRSLEPWMAWAILALAIRFVKEPPAPFSTQTEASNAFAHHARSMLSGELEHPSVSRVQALLMLTGHDWGAGNGRRAWIYLGMAIRLVEVMELTQELKVPRNRTPTREEFIDAEVRRRTAWTCFLMDSLLSGGKGRKRSLTAADMLIQLPCERESFVFGEPICTEQLDGSIRMPSYTLPIGEIGIIGYSMRAANIWGKVARWSCSDDIKYIELPWAPSSHFQQLLRELGSWRASLPHRLQYDLFTLCSHNAVEQGQAYCYMHCIYFMSTMFLHRAYLPVLGPQNGVDETHHSYNEHIEKWKEFEKHSRKELFREAAMVLEMLEEMRTFGVYFLRGLVPWIGFTIYTAVGCMLFSVFFPSREDDPYFKGKARNLVIHGCQFLKEMKTQWPMAKIWFETIQRMQAFYRTMIGQDGPASPEERPALRRAMNDYGALQPSPVQRPADASMQSETTLLPPKHSPTSHTDMRSIASTLSATLPGTSTTAPTPNGYAPTYLWSDPLDISPLEQDETFNLDGFNMSNAELEEMMMNATQDFWASFPGEVGVAYP